jgi:two-component system, chemotaxis family, chemotaxis protein CheY
METTIQPYSVLIADDSNDIRMVRRRQAEKLGFKKIECAENGSVAIEKARTFMPHLIILDIVMPEVDGLEALKQIRTFHPAAVIMVASSIAEREKILEIKNAKADLYFLKSAPMEKFVEAMEKALLILKTRFPDVKP